MPSAVGLVDRPWNTAIVFLPPASNSSSSAGGGSADTGGGSGSGSRLLVGTGYHKVRLYDSEAGKRPQVSPPCDHVYVAGLVGMGSIDSSQWSCGGQRLPLAGLQATQTMSLPMPCSALCVLLGTADGADVGGEPRHLPRTGASGCAASQPASCPASLRPASASVLDPAGS